MSARRDEALAYDLAVDLWRTVQSDWRLDASEALELLGWHHDGRHLRDVIDLGRAADRLQLVVEFAPVAAEVLGGSARVRRWLRAPNVQLGGTTPIERMVAEPEWLRFLIDSLEPLP